MILFALLSTKKEKSHWETIFYRNAQKSMVVFASDSSNVTIYMLPPLEIFHSNVLALMVVITTIACFYRRAKVMALLVCFLSCIEMRKQNDFSGKVVVITGASSGIGLACAYEFGGRGAKVALGARNIEELKRIKADLESKAISCFVDSLDVSNESECKQFAQNVNAAFGHVDVLINNAGISMRALFSEVDLSVLHRLMDVNFWGTVYCTKYFYPYLLAAKGSVVGVSSVAGFHGLPARTGYSASKFAMQGFLETIRIENLHQGLHVMVVAPGFTASNVRKNALVADGSNQGESPREEAKMMTSEEVARRIANGVAARKRQLVMTFEGKATLFLKKFVPGFLDKMVFNHMAKEPNSPFK